jgi:hypothetical protein
MLTTIFEKVMSMIDHVARLHDLGVVVQIFQNKLSILQFFSILYTNNSEAISYILTNKLVKLHYGDEVSKELRQLIELKFAIHMIVTERS